MGIIEGPAQSLGAEIVEHKAGAALILPAVELHRIRQPAGLAHDRHGAVAQAVDLVQTAGFVSRGHHERIAAGFDQVGEGDVVAVIETEFLWKMPLGMMKEIHIALLPAAQHHEAHLIMS